MVMTTIVAPECTIVLLRAVRVNSIGLKLSSCSLSPQRERGFGEILPPRRHQLFYSDRI